MGDTTIEWTAGEDGTPGKTWNPVRGCVPISPGCKHCYAKTFAERWRGVPGHPYAQGFDPRLVPSQLAAPFGWRKPHRVFVNSMSDLFLEDFGDEYVRAVFGVMAATPRHTYQVLTKRAERMRTWFDRIARATAGPHAPDTAFLIGTAAANLGVEEVDQLASHPWPLRNVWLGVSVEDRRYGVSRIDHLREVPAVVRFLSIEPLLEDVGTLDLRGIDWCIVGGESGPGARPFAVEWARNVVAQCRAQSVPVFVKQLGATPVSVGDPTGNFRTNPETGKREFEVAATRLRMRSRKGNDPSEWPEDLRVREWPSIAAPARPAAQPAL
jgi:protein gp37